MDLHSIIEHYGSDKNLSSYTPIYEKIFANYRQEKMNVLEIGIGTLLPDIPSTFIGNPRLYPHYKPGGSLRVWRDYFPNAWIYGGDVAEDCMFEEERITTLLFDSTDKTACDRHLRGLRFKIIVDDGLHTWEAQWATLQNLWEKLEDRGIYVIEDIMYPDIFKNKLNKKIRKLVGESDICPNVRGNMMYIFKHGTVDSNSSK